MMHGGSIEALLTYSPHKHDDAEGHIALKHYASFNMVNHCLSSYFRNSPDEGWWKEGEEGEEGVDLTALNGCLPEPHFIPVAMQGN